MCLSVPGKERSLFHLPFVPDSGKSRDNLIIFLPILLAWGDGELGTTTVAQSANQLKAGL